MGESGELTAWLARAAAGDAEAERHLNHRWRPVLATMLRHRLAVAPAALAEAGAQVRLSWDARLQAGELVAADRALYLEWAARLMQSVTLELAARSDIGRAAPPLPLPLPLPPSSASSSASEADGAAASTTAADDAAAPSAAPGKTKRRPGKAGASAVAEAPELLPTLQALNDLGRLGARLARVVRLRWFAAMSMAEIAAHTGSDELSVRRDWQKARAFLLAALPAAAAAPATPAAPKRRGARKPAAGDGAPQAKVG